MNELEKKILKLSKNPKELEKNFKFTVKKENFSLGDFGSYIDNVITNITFNYYLYEKIIGFSSIKYNNKKYRCNKIINNKRYSSSTNSSQVLIR